tara:strand:+ start:1596 stop:2786 length:1191 start_codon:yes stop_codon:yes gene_type:complete
VIWENATIEQTCDILDKLRKPITKSKRVAGPYPYYGATGVLDHVEGYLFNEPLVLVGEDGAKWGVGDKTAFPIEGKTWVNNHAHVLRPKRNMLIDKWLLYYIEATDLSPFITGLTVPKLNQQKLKTISFPLPSLPEQKRIVAILDEAFAGIDKAIGNTEKNLAFARELFESYLNTIFTRKGEGWDSDELVNLVKDDCSLSYGIVQPGQEYTGGLPVVRPTDLGKRVITTEGLKLIDPLKAQSYQRTTLHGNDLLLCVRGSTGDVSFAANELKGANVTRGIVPIRFDDKKILQEFGYYAFIAKPVRDQIEAGTYGAALMQINIRDVKKIKFNYPSLNEQKVFLEKLRQGQLWSEKLSLVYKQKLTSLNELKQSLLQKAFSGELTAETADEVQTEAVA